MLVSGRRTFASTSASARGADITLTVDGKEVTVPQGFGGLYTLHWMVIKLIWIFKKIRFRVEPGLRGGRSDSEYTQVCLSLAEIPLHLF